MKVADVVSVPTLKELSTKLAAYLEVDRESWVPMLEMCCLMLLWGLANNLNGPDPPGAVECP